jgi:hypothetical protein
MRAENAQRYKKAGAAPARNLFTNNYRGPSYFLSSTGEGGGVTGGAATGGCAGGGGG